MPEAARIGDTITHTNKLGGFLAGALLGAAVGAFVVATGGAGALVIAGAVATGASLGSQVGKLLGGMKKVPKGQIITGAASVFINGRAAARACVDTARCDDHTVKKIAMGSATVGIESGAAARIGDKGECGFEVGEGSANVIIGGEQGMCPGLSVDEEVPAWLETASLVLGLAGAGGLMRAAGWGALRIGASLAGGEIGARVGGHFGQKWGGTWGGVFGSLVGGLAGGGAGSWAGRRATPFVNRLEVRTVGLGSNLGNVRVGLRPTTAATQSMDDWARGFPRKPTPNNTPRDAYEIKHTGPENVQVEGGGSRVWADGVRPEDARLLEAKHVTNPDRSPFVSDSKVPDFVREKIVADVDDEFRRYGAVVNDPNTPVKGLEVITNDPRAVPFFEGLMQKHNIPGQVVVKP